MAENKSGRSAGPLDAVLLRVAMGERAAFEELYRRTCTKLFGLCLRIVNERQEAEDVLQEAFLAVWRQAGAFDPARGTAMTWLITLTRNRAIDRLRRRGRLASAPIELAEALPDDAPDAEARVLAQSDAERLAYCLARLEEGDAGLLRSAFFEGATYAELAERAARPLGTIKSRIRRALIGLRGCMA